MQISPRTISLLKNFATINNSIYIKQGSEIFTTSPDKTIVGSAKTEEVFPMSFGIYDLNRFLSLVSFVDHPEFTFKDEFVVVSSGKSKTNYRYADPLIVAHRNNFEQVEKYIRGAANSYEYPVSFTLTDVDFQDFTKKCSVLKLPDIKITSLADASGNKVVLEAHDKKNDLSDRHTLVLEETVNQNFVAQVAFDKLKILGGDYKIDVAPNVLHLAHTQLPVEYWVCPETDTTFE